jgi:cardiolipin synthase (CMP-forming)
MAAASSPVESCPAQKPSTSSNGCARSPDDRCVRNLTVANQLTILRIVLIPAFVLLVVYGELGAALLVFVTAGITDALDGLIARRAGQRTSLGAWLDPMADKLLLVTTFIVLTLPDIPLTNHLPLWLTVIVISRDIVIIGVVAIVNLAVGRRTFKPSVWGKMTTAAFIVTSVVVMFFNYLRRTSLIVDIAIWTSLALTLISSTDYFFKLRKLTSDSGA